MRVLFLTEGDWYGKVQHGNANMRTDLAWQHVMDGNHAPLLWALNSLDEIPNDSYDLGIVILPKKNIEAYTKHDIMKLRDTGKIAKITVMQEGANWFWQDWDLTTQIWYISLLQRADFLLCHNQTDLKYYKGLLNRDDVFKMPTLLLESSIQKSLLTMPENRSGVMIGGNMVSWYNGFDSYAIASIFDEQLYAPSMGRKQASEDMIENITYLPYMGWSDWITELSKRKYAVHLIRNRLAGTFALNCAYLGIPCIGYRGLDTQERCFPKLSFDVGDLDHARFMANHLKNNTQFYNHCSVFARSAWKEFYHEDVFRRDFLTSLETLVIGTPESNKS